MTDFCEIMKKIRHDKGLTLKELAEKSGVHPNTINSWELGGASPTIHNYEAVLNALGLTLEITVKER